VPYLVRYEKVLVSGQKHRGDSTSIRRFQGDVDYHTRHLGDLVA